MKKLFTTFLLVSSLSFAYGSNYSETSDELCDFLHEEYGFHEMTLYCAAIYGQRVYTVNKNRFCHKMILNEVLSIPECFDLMGDKKIRDIKFKRCLKMTSKRRVLACLK